MMVVQIWGPVMLCWPLESWLGTQDWNTSKMSTQKPRSSINVWIYICHRPQWNWEWRRPLTYSMVCVLCFCIFLHFFFSFFLQFWEHGVAPACMLLYLCIPEPSHLGCVVIYSVCKYSLPGLSCSRYGFPTPSSLSYTPGPQKMLTWMFRNSVLKPEIQVNMMLLVL